MKYDFVTLPDRTASSAEKFLNMRTLNPEAGKKIVPFSVADMDFLPPPELVEGLTEYIRNTIFGYTLVWDSYYESVQKWLRERHGLEFPREYLMDVDNVIAAMRQMLRAFTSPGDGIVVMTPAYPAFPSSICAVNRRMLSCPLKLSGTAYTPDLDLLENLCSRADTTMLVMCNPHNPIGRLWSREELEQISEICLRHQVFVLSDEIHWDLIFPGAEFTSMASLEEKYLRNCAVSTSFTKTFNLAALKGATLIMADETRRQKYEEYNTIPGRDILSYAACEIAYTRCREWLDELKTVLASNQAFLKEYMKDYIPEVTVLDHNATYLQWLDFRFLHMEPKELEHFMAYEAQCFFTEGYKFGEGGAGFERWNFACPQDTLYQGLERMRKAVQRWKETGGK